MKRFILILLIIINVMLYVAIYRSGGAGCEIFSFGLKGGAMPALDTLSKVLLLFSGICSIVGLGVSIGMYLTKIRSLEAKSNKADTAIETIKSQMSTRLYHKDGAPIYMSTVSCKECRTDCQTQRRQDIEDVKNQLDEIKDGVNKIIDMHLKKASAS